MGNTVLLVEDDSSIRALISVLLSGEGYEIVEADDGNDGLTKARTLRPDLMILDLMMPGMGGETVLAELKKDPGFDAMPLLVVTGKEEAIGRIKDLIGDDNVFRKPFEPIHLVDRVTALLGVPKHV